MAINRAGESSAEFRLDVLCTNLVTAECRALEHDYLRKVHERRDISYERRRLYEEYKWKYELDRRRRERQEQLKGVSTTRQPPAARFEVRIPRRYPYSEYSHDMPRFNYSRKSRLPNMREIRVKNVRAALRRYRRQYHHRKACYLHLILNDSEELIIRKEKKTRRGEGPTNTNMNDSDRVA